MEDLKKKAWELRKKMASNVTKASLSSLTGAIFVPLEVVSHISPIYWIYKVKTYTPGTREIETLDFFDDAKDYIKQAKSANQELRETKIQQSLKTTVFNQEVVECVNSILSKCTKLEIKVRKEIILTIKKVLNEYTDPKDIISRLAIIEESIFPKRKSI